MKKSILLLLLSFCSILAGKAQVVVSTPPSLSNLCVGNAAYVALGTITITETNNTDIPNTSNTATPVTLTMPTGFELQPATGAVNITGGGGGSISGVVVSASAVNFNFSTNNTNSTGFTISGLNVRAITSAGSGNMTATVGGGVNGMTAVVSFASFASVAPPNAPAITGGSAKTYCVGTATSTAITATGTPIFEWYSDVALTMLLHTGATPTLFNLGITSTASASSTIVYALTNDGTCKSVATTVTIAIVNNPAPNISGANPKNFCVNASGTTTVSATGTGTIEWFSDMALTLPLGTGASISLATLGISTGAASTTTVYAASNHSACYSAPVPLVININALPTVSVVNSGTTACVGGSLFFSASGTSQYKFEVKQGVTSIAVQAFSNTATYTTSNTLPAGSYTMDITGRDVNNCESDVALTTVPFTITTLPTSPAITGGSSKSFCVGTNAGTTTINATGSPTIRWYSDIGLTTEITAGTAAAKTLTNLGITTGVASTTTFYLVSDNGTCKSTPTPLTVSIDALPTLSVFATFTSFCAGQTATFIGAGAGGTGLEYEFAIGATVVQAFSPTSFYTTLSSLAAGTYNMNVRVRNVQGCVSTVNITPFSVNALPAAPGTASIVNYCVGATMTNFTTAVVAGTVIEWYSDPALAILLTTGTNVTPASLGIVNTAPNVYTRYVTQRNTTTNCRSSIVTVTINIVANPSVTLSAPVSQICQGETITFTASGNATEYRFARRLNGTLQTITGFSPVATLTIPVLPVSDLYTMQVEGRNAAGCTTLSSFFSFEIKSNPTATFTATGTPTYLVSQNTPVDLLASPFSSNIASLVPPLVGTFSGTSVVGSNFTPSAAGVGSHVVRFTVLNTVTGCSAFQEVTIVVDSPVANSTILAKYCQGSGNQLLGNVVSGCHTQITNVLSFAPFDGSVYPNPIVNVAGLYYLNTDAITIPIGQDYIAWSGIVLFSNPACTGGFFTFQFVTTNIYRKPAPVITGNLAPCAGSTQTYSVPTLGNSAYNWTVSGGLAFTDGSNGISLTFPTVTVPTTYTIGVRHTINHTSPNTQTCFTDSPTITVTVYPLPALPTANITTASNVCRGSTHTYTAPAGNTYLWNVANGAITLGSNTTQSITVEWSATAPTGALQLQLTSIATGCNSTFSQAISLIAFPNPILNPANDYEVCVGEIKTYSATFSGANTYLWTATNSSTVATSANSISVIWNTIGTQTLTLVQTNVTGCATTITKDVNVNPALSNTITGTTSVCEDNTYTYSASTAGTYSYNWTVTNGVIQGLSTSSSVVVKWNTGVVAGTLNLSINEPSTGCSTSRLQNIIVNPLPTPAITGSATVCASSTRTYSVPFLAGRTWNWIVTGGVISGANNNNTVTVIWGTSVAGSLTVTEIVTATFCSRQTATNVAINPLPTPAIIGKNPTCGTEEIDYETPDVVNNTYTWSVANGSIVGANNTSKCTVKWNNVLLPTIGVITLTQTNTSTSCQTTITRNITVNPLPAPSITGSPIACQEQVATYSVPFVAGHTYDWDVIGSTGITNPTPNSIQVTWGTNGLGRVLVEQRNLGTGCSKIEFMNVTLFPRPNPVITGVPVVCALQGSVSYSVPNVVGNNYVWVITGGTVASGVGTNAITVDWGSNPVGAQVLVTQTVIPTGCSRQVTLPIIMNPRPAPSISPTTNTCIGSPLTNDVSYTTSATAGSSYSWSVTNGSIISGQNTNTVVVRWGNTGASGTIQIVQTLLTGCASSDFKTITFNPLPVPAIVGDDTPCANSNNINYQTASGGTAYTWSVIGGSIASGQGSNNINVNWLTAGIGSVKVEETNANGCKKEVTMTTNILSLPNPDITPKTAVCAFSVGNVYQVTNNVGSTYTWAITGGLITFGASTNAITVNWGSAGVGTLRVTETFFSGCSTTTPIQNIIINPLPTPSITGAKAVCAQQNAVSYSVTPLPSHSYSWSVAGGSVVGSNTNSSVTIDWGNAGMGTITVRETNNITGCINATTEAITIRPLPTPTITGNAQVCEFTNGIVYETTDLPTSPNVTHTYAWSVSNGVLAINGLTPYKAEIDWLNAGTETITLIVTTTTTDPFLPTTSCQTIVTKIVTVNPKPTPFITPRTAVCELSAGIKYTTNNQTGRTYNWTVIGGTIVNGQSTNEITVNWGSAGNAFVQLTETIITTGCTQTNGFNLILNPLPHPAITLGNTMPVIPVCELTASHIYQTALNAGSTYTWQVTGGSFTPVSGNPHQIEVAWSNAGTGSVTVAEKTANNCEKTTTQNITINPLPAPSISGNTTVCEFSPQTYSVPFTVGSSYSWYAFKLVFPIPLPIAFSTNANGNEMTINNMGVFGSVILGVEETNVNGCIKEVSFDVDINKLPNPDITPKNDVCLNTVQTYQTAFTNTSNYVWTLTPASAGTLVQGSTPTTKHQATVTWNVATPILPDVPAVLKVTETDVNGCINTKQANINVRSLPNPIITTDLVHGFSVCAGQVGVKYSVIGLAGNSYSWTVLGGAIVGSNLGNEITVNWGAAGIGTVEVIQIDNNFVTKCATAVSQNITIRPLPAPVITSGTGIFQVCAAATSTYSTPLVAGHNYAWTIVGGIITAGANSNSITVDWGTNPAGASLTVVETNANFPTNCKQTSTQNIVIRPLPTPNITGDASVCAQSAGKVYAVDNEAGHTYFWTVTTGRGNIIGSRTGNSITVNWLGVVGVAQVEVIQTDANFPTSCAVTRTLNVTIQPLPTPNITGTGIDANTKVCATTDALNFYENTYSTTQVAGNSYVWTINPAQGDITSGQFSGTIRVRWKQGIGTGTVTVAQTTNTFPACTVTDTKTVIVNDLPATNFNIANLCFGELTTFTPTVVPPNTAWRWTLSEGLPINAQDASRTFITTGLKTAKLLVKNTLTGCEYERDTTFTIHPVPVADFTFGNSCISSPNIFTTQFTDLSTVAVTDTVKTWQWTISKIGTTTINYTVQNPVHTFLQAGTYTVTLIATTNNNCSHTITKDVRIFPIIQPTEPAPYTQDFEAGEGNWISHGVGNTWQRGIPAANRTIQSAGSNIWTTGLNANYNNNAQAYVESPCFDLSQLTKPMISLKTWVDADNKADGASLLYSVDGGNNWKTLGAVGKGVDWYNEENVLGIPSLNDNPRKAGWTGKKQTDWVTAKYNLDAVMAEAVGRTVRFRVTFSSNPDNPAQTLDGFAFDDVYIGNRQKRALIEHFTTMDANTENDFVDNFSTEATKLQYHTQSILYNDNKADPTARSLMYGIAVTSNANTRGVLNGVTDVNKKFSLWGLDEAERQLLGTPFFDISLAFLPNPVDKLNVQVKLKALQTYTKDVVLHIVMVEQDINNAQVGTTIYRNVVKKMIPSAAGKTLRDDWTAGQERTYNESITLYDVLQSTSLAPKYYDWNKLKIVAFVQDFASNEVLQAAESIPATIPSRVSSLADDGQGSVKLYPNPATSEVFIGFDQEAVRTYDWEIQNIQGQIVQHGTIPKGDMGVQVRTTDLPAGMYIVRILHPQNKSSWVGKLVIKQ